METLGLAAVVALVLNLLSVIHYGTRLRRDLVDQVKADEKRWSEHETRLALLERALERPQGTVKRAVNR